MMQNEIHVAFATDNGYLAPTFIAVSTLLDHLDKNTLCHIHIMVPDDIEIEKINLFKKVIEDTYFSEYSLEFIIVDDGSLDFLLNDDVQMTHISKTTYYRFMIPQLLPTLSKCLYLDVDIVVNKDISELYRTDINDYLIAGVKNTLPSDFQNEYRKKRLDELGIPNLQSYINAGVVLMNLDLIRKLGLVKKWLQLAITKTFTYNDQDILNSTCYGKIKIIDDRFNALFYYLSKPALASKLLGYQYLSNINDATIIHYASPQKPWFSKFVLFSKYWWDAYNKSPVLAKEHILAPFIKKSLKKYTVREQIILFLKSNNSFRKIWFNIVGSKKTFRCLFRVFKFRIKGLSIQPPYYIGNRCNMEIVNGAINISRNVYIKSDCSLVCNGGKIEIEENVFLNRNTSITSMCLIKIGTGTTVANNVTIVDHDHDRVGIDFIKCPVVIGRNVWIGANSTILKGVEIGDGAIIAAGSVVTKSLPSNCIAGGVPAKILKQNKFR